MTQTKPTTPAAPTPPRPNSGPVQLHYATYQRDLSGRPTAVMAGHAEVSEGTPVLTVDGHFRAACVGEGTALVDETLRDAIARWEQGGGRAKFDELTAKLEKLFADIAAERMLANGYREKARELSDNYGEPAEVLKWRGYAEESKRKAERLEREVPLLLKYIGQEREIVRQTLERTLQDAQGKFRHQHLAAAHAAETEALAAFLPAYATALKDRLIAGAATRDSVTRWLDSVSLAEPKRPVEEQPPALTGGAAIAVAFGV